MKIEIGKMIKKLRLKKSVTQEELALKMGVSCQAVSKWENGITAPDLSLLPELAVYFGVTIDELFEMTDEAHLERIENMIMDERILSEDDFNYANQYLLDKINEGEKEAVYFRTLADLYAHKAENYRYLAANYVKKAIELEPESKDSHAILNCALNGIIPDWNIANHHELIDYYKDFVEKNPNYARGYLWLLDSLIEDGRTEEARVYLEKMRKVEDDLRVPLYKGLILKEECKLEEAEKAWNVMLEKYPENWLSNACYADCMAKLCRYDEAVIYYRKAFELQPKPRYTDAFQAIAHIEEIRGNYHEAIEARKNQIKLLQEEWNISLGETVDFPKREINRLNKLK